MARSGPGKKSRLGAPDAALLPHGGTIAGSV